VWGVRERGDTIVLAISVGLKMRKLDTFTDFYAVELIIIEF
jgi:hypothetical protein